MFLALTSTITCFSHVVCQGDANFFLWNVDWLGIGTDPREALASNGQQYDEVG